MRQIGKSGELRLEPVERVCLSQVVLEKLLARLEDGTLRPGDRLPSEYELMRLLSVGRSSVREALRVMITLSLVETKPGRGAVVASKATNPLARIQEFRNKSVNSLHKWAVLDLLEVRESLEGQAAALAATRATPEDLENIEYHTLKVENQAKIGRTYFQENSNFHVAIARSAHNVVLIESVRHLIGQLRFYREYLMRRVKDMPDRDVAEHRAILRAIREKDPEQARAAVVAHIRGYAEIVRGFDDLSIDKAAPDLDGPNGLRS